MNHFDHFLVIDNNIRRKKLKSGVFLSEILIALASVRGILEDWEDK